MKIVICGSMTSAHKMREIANKLLLLNHAVTLPKGIEKFLNGKTEETQEESTTEKLKNDLIRDYFKKIKNSDAILVVNIDKNNIKNYIGGNAFLEIGFAHVLNKKIFLLNEIPDITYSSEIRAMQPTVINGDLTKIK